jgi:hypothetical protein
MHEEREPEKAQEKEVDQTVDTNEVIASDKQEEDKEELDAGIGGRPAKKG